MENFKEYVHVLIVCSSNIAFSKIVQYLKGRLSRLVQDEYLELKKGYWEQYLWSRGYFYAIFGSTIEETIKKYIENQKDIFEME